jgi:hypothetical protein
MWICKTLLFLNRLHLRVCNCHWSSTWGEILRPPRCSVPQATVVRCVRNLRKTLMFLTNYSLDRYITIAHDVSYTFILPISCSGILLFAKHYIPPGILGSRLCKRDLSTIENGSQSVIISRVCKNPCAEVCKPMPIPFRNGSVHTYAWVRGGGGQN